MMRRKRRKRIEELTLYLEEVNINGTGSILQTKEDEFSQLQDEIYKTVTALYQTRENALKVKENYAENLANIAHQLKTSITAATISLSLADIEQTRRQLKRLNTLEEALLMFSRIDSGSLELQHTLVDVYTVLNLAADNLNDYLTEKNISVSIPEKDCVTMQGDMDWTMEAIINLLKNCAEHSPENGTIYCDYDSNPLYTTIMIRDEGRGFVKEDLPHLFERFYRGKDAVPGGIGIGLTLAKSIFEMQNGNITAKNIPDGGACFEIRIYCH